MLYLRLVTFFLHGRGPPLKHIFVILYNTPIDIVMDGSSIVGQTPLCGFYFAGKYSINHTKNELVLLRHWLILNSYLSRYKHIYTKNMFILSNSLFLLITHCSPDYLMIMDSRYKINFKCRVVSINYQKATP